MNKNILLATCIGFFMIACDSDDPDPENAEEIITDVTLSFNGTGGGAPLEFKAVDPDGDGPQNLQIQGDIILQAGQDYVLTIDMQNSIEGESISAEVEEEADEHMIFFGWTDGLFTDPTGDGNVDNRSDAVNYNDQDGSGFPLGLNTSWNTASSGSGTFRIILKHQPGSKSATSTATTGETDVDLSWNITVE
ncbi:MAG: hypothetical protein RJQ09_02850 [Cyclobacteriaceae bacterium]